jgi:hypothetical protein
LKLPLTILLLISLTANSQSYVASWTGWGHLSYQIQQAIDTNRWQTIGTVNGQIAQNNYQFTVPGPTYYYRIKADKDSTKAILVSEVLSIKNPPSKGKKSRIQALSVKVSVTDMIHYTIESPQVQQMRYSLYDITGRKIKEMQVNLHEGTNEIYDSRPVVRGIYYSQFVGYFDFITAKIINE